MNIIEQIDAWFKRFNAQDIPPILVNIDLNYQQWQQIKAELAKVREDALEEAAQVCEDYSKSFDELIRTANKGVSEHLQISREGKSRAAYQL